MTHRLLEADTMRQEHANGAEVQFYTATEFRALREAAEGPMRAMIAIGGLAGLPERVNKILNVVGNSELEVNVKTPDARLLLNGFEKIANRVTTGIILAAMIVGAALMMRINSSFQIFGYPGIAMLCFLIALGGSGWLVLGILWKDYKDKRKQKE
jgi:hypothetical protein